MLQISENLMLLDFFLTSFFNATPAFLVLFFSSYPDTETQSIKAHLYSNL